MDLQDITDIHRLQTSLSHSLQVPIPPLHALKDADFYTTIKEVCTTMRSKWQEKTGYTGDRELDRRAFMFCIMAECYALEPEFAGMKIREIHKICERAWEMRLWVVDKVKRELELEKRK